MEINCKLYFLLPPAKSVLYSFLIFLKHMPDNLYNLNIHQLNLLLYRCLYLLHNPIGFLYILSFFLCRNRLDDSAKVVKAPKTKNGVKDKAANENLLPSTKSLNNKMNESEENA